MAKLMALVCLLQEEAESRNNQEVGGQEVELQGAYAQEY